MLAISRMLRMERDPEANLTALELLQRTPLEQLEQTVKALKKHRPAAEELWCGRQARPIQHAHEVARADGDHIQTPDLRH